MAIPRLEIAPGALSAVKWLALALMVVDHVDAFVYGRALGWATDMGRLVFPLFGFVLAYNLARPGALVSGMHVRLLQRLAVFGLAALPFHAALRGGVLPLNIMATFAVAVGVVVLIDRERWHLAGILFVAGGVLVEYSFPGVAVVVAAWAFLRAPGPALAGVVLLAMGSLYAVNGSHVALLAIPVLLLAAGLRVTLPRLKWAFWAFYPVHLAAFWMILAGV